MCVDFLNKKKSDDDIWSFEWSSNSSLLLEKERMKRKKKYENSLISFLNRVARFLSYLFLYFSYTPNKNFLPFHSIFTVKIASAMCDNKSVSYKCPMSVIGT